MRGTVTDLRRALLSTPAVASAQIVERADHWVVAHLRVGPGPTISEIRDSVRDVMREQLAVGLCWIALVNRSLIVRAPARLNYHEDSPPVGQIVYLKHAIFRQSWLATMFLRAVNRALWWRRTDVYVVHRVIGPWVELERLRWSWGGRGWIRDHRLTADERRALGLCDDADVG